MTRRISRIESLDIYVLKEDWAVSRTRNLEVAEAVADMLYQLTGEPTRVVTEFGNLSKHEIQRWTGSKWVRG